MNTTKDVKTPDDALELLKEGNTRFTNNVSRNQDYLEQVKLTAGGQKPFAAILGCIDSRAPAEIIFDRGIGDIFNVRIAGNIVNDDIIGSLEFATKLAGSKLIVVLGHTSCGAVKGALGKAELGKLTGLVQKLDPAVQLASSEAEGASEDEMVDLVADKNVELMTKELTSQSPVLAELVDSGEIKIVGAVYDVGTGKVDFK